MIGEPTQATVVKVAVTEGQTVVKGERLLALGAIKMKQLILASRDGIVAQINVTSGDSVASGAFLAKFLQAR